MYWSDWQNFGYLFEALLKFTWETPCGLLVDGKSDLGRDLACCDASFQGIDYCPENDNPLLRCPYERKDCPHSISGFPVPLCPCHTTGKRYSFEQSAEKVETERSERQHRQYMEITGGLDNIFRILRVECVWRLTYRDVPASERFGVRAALHFTF